MRCPDCKGKVPLTRTRGTGKDEIVVKLDPKKLECPTCHATLVRLPDGTFGVRARFLVRRYIETVVSYGPGGKVEHRFWRQEPNEFHPTVKLWRAAQKAAKKKPRTAGASALRPDWERA